jgi:hypothetical protein
MPLLLNPETAFVPEQRAELLGACLPAIVRRDRVVEMVEAGDASVRSALLPELDRLNDQIRGAWEDYQSRLPVLKLSRCPFTSDVWSHSIDPYGIDGFWWSYYKPIRLLHEPLGGRCVAFRGAMKPPAEPSTTPFLVSPGPDIPFLIARLMQFPSMTAVISHLRIGELDAYPIVYFTSAELPNDQRSNDWGTDSYSFRSPAGHYEHAEYFDAEDEFLYGLEPWIEQKRLQWIEPGDDTMTLRTGTADCPYVNLQGKRAVWRMKSGRLWWGPPGKS